MKNNMEKRGVLVIIFGATGDLSKRKLLPSIYRLINDNVLSHVHILAIGRKPYTTKKLILESKKYFSKSNNALIKKMINKTTYVRGDFTDDETYKKIRHLFDEGKKDGIHKKIFYLATGSNLFPLISKKMKRWNLASRNDGKTKVVYEKPFGRDEKSSKKLNDSIKKLFSEEQTYRIDHYLGKELVGAVSILRFTNRIFEPIWNNKHIDNIQIILDENIGIDERGPYYDTYGAVRDMVQNHMLQLLSLLTMEMPKLLTGNLVRDKKAELLKKVIIKDYLLGQYRGYTSEKGIPKSSTTETFAALRLEINNPRWKNTPIFFRTGKYLDKKESRIIINFKKAKCLFDHECTTKANALEIRIKPNEGINLSVNIKSPRKNDVSRIKMDFCYSCEFGSNTPEGYENLFSDIIKGDQTVFTRMDELQNAWRVVDKIKRNKLYTYKKGSKGPKEMEEWGKKNKVEWS